MAENHRACASCGTENDEDARFCEGCGAALGRTCGTCGVEANATARFCRACGAPLGGQTTPSPEGLAAGPSRKTVTVMFADLAGSTTFEEQVDAETARDVMSRYHDLLRSTAERNRAGVTKYIGDGFMAVWGVPEVGPDDAGRAVDAAVELQEHFIDFAARATEARGVELALRVAVNTGEVVVGAGDADLVGDALNVAARLEAECPRGHVVVGEETWRSTRGGHRYESLGQVQVKGRTAPVVVYQWLGRQSEATDATPFVGRADEVRRLQSALNDAVAAQAARLVTVIGDPGVGKSRLAAEFTETQGDARVIEARCDVEATVALGPIVEVLRARDLDADVPVGVPERDRVLRDLNGLAAGVPGSVEETFWALRRYIEMLARDGPLVIVADDIQWADTLLLDFIEHLAEWVQEVPVLVLALARPELREVRPDLVTVSRWVSEAIHLGGLDPGATAELAAGVLGAARLPGELLGRLPSSTGGNPLFVRELVGMLVHDGVLVAEPAGWRLTIDVDAIAIPPTIQALLASRLERLNAADRRVLEIASVVGTDFSLGAVCALAERGSREVKGSLDRLRRLDLAQPSGAYLGDEPVWRFHHVLIRDVAYRRLLKSDRADLHERLGNWVESGGASAAFDSDEMVARHLEAAHGYRRELGTADEHTGDLALRSARCYLASARRALDRDELISAGTQAARGAALAVADSAVHAELLLVGCEAFLSAGDVAAGAPLVDDLDRIAGEELAPWATCYRCQFVVYTDPERLLELDARLQGAIDEFGRRKDPAGLAKAHRVRASARGRLGRIGDCEVDLFEALIAARQGGDHRQITAALGAAPSAALWGPSPVPKAGGRCLDVVRMQRMTTAAPSLEATSLRCLAVLELLRGRPDKARTMLADARQIVADLGLRHGLMETELFAGIIESMVGDEVAAEPHFRTAMEGLDALGVGADAGQAAALLARSVLAQGRVDEADRYAAESERIAGHNLKTAIAWRAVRAEILAAQGQTDEAAAMAHDAVAVAVGTDLVLDHADACLTLSRVLAVAGDAKGAKDARDDADKLYAAKEVASSIGRTTEPVVSAALMPAPAEPGPTTSRLAVKNRASATVDGLWRIYQAHNVGGAIGRYFSDRLVYDDRRRLSGDPVVGLDAMQAASERALEQYPHSEWRTLAVRGERLDLRSIRMWDDAGNEATTLNVFELDDHGRVEYWSRFDEDDFEGAYRELEQRYCAREGAAYAEAVATSTEWTVALNRADFDRLFDELTVPDFRVENRSRSAFPDRTASEHRTTLEELAAMVISARSWNSTMCWLSPNCCVTRGEREAVGEDGEHYAWSFALVVEVRGGQVASMCQFESDDEDAAFAYADTLAAPRSSRLEISNRASEVMDRVFATIQRGDIDGAVAFYMDGFTYNDRRQLSGDPITNAAGLRNTAERIRAHYNRFEGRALAVRGERLQLSWSRWSDDAGNEATHLHVIELGGDSQILYEGRFDEDDFENAYRDLEHRYYAGEGAAHAAIGRTIDGFVDALDRLDVEAARRFVRPDCRWVVPASMLTLQVNSVEDFIGAMRQRAQLVSSLKNWVSVIHWSSPTCIIGRSDVRGVGSDGEDYTWSRLNVVELLDGLVASVRQFDVDDEEAAFAYAETLVAPQSIRLPVTNLASESVDAACRALQAHDVDSAVAVHSDRFVYDDRRPLSGEPIESIAELRTASARLLEQYDSFEWRTLAVRGECLALAWSCWSDEAGNEAIYLAVFEVDDDGQIIHHVRFDGDDIDAAYLELEDRYYAGEGAAFAANGRVVTDWMAAMDRLDVDAARGLARPEFRWLALPTALTSTDHSVDELFQWLQERRRQVSSVRHTVTAIRWPSPNCCIGLGDAKAVGLDGEDYVWTRLYVGDFRDGLLASVREFGLDDEEAAFAYAEALVTPRRSRLPVSNRASEALNNAERAMQAHDADMTAGFYSERFTYDDRRQLSGDPINDRAGVRDAAERILAQYTRFEGRTLAVRGECSQLSWSLWSDDDGNETTYLRLVEIDDDGRIFYEGRFDEDDFEGAYRELEHRYYAGEGAAYAGSGATLTDAVTAANRGDLARVFDELCVPELRIENRSRSAFPDRSAAELRASMEELDAMVASVRTWYSAVRWLSPTWFAYRQERDAVGLDGEKYQWVRLYVGEIRGGRATSLCEFDVEDEDAAFVYAEERMRATASRLALTNRASEAAVNLARAMQSRDVAESLAAFSERIVYDDRRRLSGEPIQDRTALRAALERVFEQFTGFDWHTLAVRGDRLVLSWSRWSDDAGNETTTLYVFELGDDARFGYMGRFDEDDFEEAYRELERRYYSGEGTAFAEGGSTLTDSVIAVNRGDLDRAFRDLATPDAVMENRSRSIFGDRSAEEYRASIEELQGMVASSRVWYSAVCWLSPAWVVTRAEREAVGHDGEQYTWTKAYAVEILNGRPATACEFDLEDEESAFAYAEERMRATSSRLAVTNRATEVGERLLAAFRERNVDAALEAHSDQFVYDDRRRLTGDPLVGRPGLRAAHERVFEQYSVFDGRTLAVRGERLQLAWGRWSDDAGNATTSLHVFEIGDDARITYHGRFEEDDFEDAYRELERRYYAGEGAAYADSGATLTEVVVAHNRGDLDRVFSELVDPGMLVENRSRSAFPNRSAAELRASTEELHAMVTSVRMCYSVVCWLSRNWFVARQDREAVGLNGEKFEWTQLYVAEIRDGLVRLTCAFDVEDEEQAFALAEERMRAASSRLALTNRATELMHGLARAFEARDPDAIGAAYSEQFVFDDHRRLSGDPIEDRAGMRAASARIYEQYSVFEGRTLAVRGQRVGLFWSRWADDSGNETTYLHVIEVGDDARIIYNGRFDEDDFEGAYRELERRYFASEGAAFAESGSGAAEAVIAKNRGDLDTLFNELSHPDMRIESRSRSLFVERSAAEYRASIEELIELVGSFREWLSAVCWLSPSWFVSHLQREAVGHEGEQYEWSRIIVGEVRDGRIASLCDFEIDDEEPAFAYAEERMRAASSRLAVTNRASEVALRIVEALQARDVDGAVAPYSEQAVYDDRRRLTGDPVAGHAEMRAATERILEQYSVFENRTLAVRGERIQLSWTRWADDSGNETNYLHVFELGEDGRVAYAGRFDEDDFDGAYREIDRRYYAGEGAAYAATGPATTEIVVATNRGDFDRLFDELILPDLQVENRSLSGVQLQGSSATDLRAANEQLHAMVASVRVWNSAVCWLSPTSLVARYDREAIGRDGERYEWTLLLVGEFRDGRLAWMGQFDVDNEEGAFAYAEERMRAAPSRLAVTNRASETAQVGLEAMKARNIEAQIGVYSDQFVYDDRRRMSGHPIEGRAGLRAAMERIHEQYSIFEARTLAVRGERLQLGWMRWSNDAGFETAYLFVHEVDESGRIEYEGRFDEDDFDGAYRELERRYYAGEGAAFAEAGATVTEWLLALNRNDFDRMFGEFTSPDFRAVNRSRSAFPDRSAADYRVTLEDLAAMVASSQVWNSAEYWLSPTCGVFRSQREAVGQDGERFAWSWLIVAEVRDGRAAGMCEFEPEDEVAAFAYAEERVRATASRLAVTNRASETVEAGRIAMRANDVDALVALYSDRFEYDDRRRLSGGPRDTPAALRAAVEHLLGQYPHFEWRRLAVRGDRLELDWSRWWDDAGNEATHLHVFEIGDDGRITYDGRFDEDDFEGAYRELERRYYAGEAAAFAEPGLLSVEWVIAVNEGDFDRAFGEFFTADAQVENRSRSAFPDPAVSEPGASFRDLQESVAALRTWNSAVCWLSPAWSVTRLEREAVGQDGETYTWTWLSVNRLRDGRLASACMFDPEDEEAAFAYAEERMRATSSRLAVTNRASEIVDASWLAMRNHDLDATFGYMSDQYVLDDKWPWGGDPIEGQAAQRGAMERIFEQYPHFEWRTLAVRGERLALVRSRWYDDAGNETTHLHVFEVDEDALITYQGRFDEDDFETADRELERRYYAGEGAAFAECGVSACETPIALNEGEFDRFLSEFCTPDLHVENRTRSAFPDRSASDLRSSLVDLSTMVAATRTWISVVCWLSPACSVVRLERDAIGQDGEQYAWTRVIVSGHRAGRFASMCEFELEDEAAAFAYAEERMRLSE